MSQDFETLNKQITAFIIVSSAFATPAFADGGMIGGNTIPIPSVQQDLLLRYAGPAINPEPPMIIPVPSSPQEPMVVKYAGPGMGGEWSRPAVSESSSLPNQIRQLKNPESLRVINSADSVTVNSSENEHDYGEVKVAPGHFKFW